MNGNPRFVGLLMSALVLVGCSTGNQQAQQQAIDTMSTPFAGGAITLQLRAEPGLNTFNDLPNSCTVLLVQAANNSALDKVLNNPVTVKSLFAGAGGEGDVLQVDRYVMMPGQSNTLHIDRAINTRSIALVAGYYPFPAKQHMFRMDIPVETKRYGWFSSEWQASLMPVTLTVVLGKVGIVDASRSDKQTDQATQVPADSSSMEDNQ